MPAEVSSSRHASICLVLLAIASVAPAETDPEPELRTERPVTPPSRGADWPVWSGPEGNLTSPGNGLFDRGDAGDGGAFVEKLAAAEKKSERVESFLAEHPTLPVL